MGLFKKAAICTDIHLGLKSNSIQHNEDCKHFIRWFTQTAKEHGCETAMFLGDWHNNRASINIVTLNYSLRALEHLNENFDQTFFIPGNHDLYYRDKRDIQSVEWARHLGKIHICNDWFVSNDVIIAPWLVGEDYKKIKKLSGRYMFGHFELPHFYMNAMVQMPDHGEIKSDDFDGIGHVYSGHFHKRQTSKNITYLGNCFPHNYADAGDKERGMMILEWDKEPQYISWPDQPTYDVYNISTVLENADAILRPNQHVRINLDIDLSYEEANFIKETFIKTYKLREITLIPTKKDDMGQFSTPGELKFESVDQIVISELNVIDSQHYDKNILLDIYQHL